MADTTTQAGGDPVGYLMGIEDEARRADALALDALFRRATGREPALWAGSMLGYGRYAYTYESGRTGVSLATGFAPRKGEIAIYVMPGDQDYGSILARLGKHRMGKACLHVRRLSDIDLAVLEELIRTGLRDLAARWPVTD